MSNQYLSEIRMFAGNFAPLGWAFCQGQLLPIQNHTALFSLIGTTYGGDGKSTFALPNLEGRVPIGEGQGPGLEQRDLGLSDGRKDVSLTLAEIPAHSHTLRGSANSSAFSGPQDHVFATSVLDGRPAYGASPNTDMNAGVVGTAGGGQAHNNEQPYLTLNFIIALQGVFPPRP